MTNILFIGGAGFIGAALVKRFILDENYKSIVLEPERSNKIRLNPLNQKIIIEQGDLRDSALVLKIIQKYRIKIVVHLVSTMIPGSTMPHFQNEMEDIIVPTMNIMELCAEYNIKFVYFSSGGTVYGNSKTIHHEADPCEPISYYGLSKLTVENMITFEHRKSGLEYLIIRPSNPYGPGQNIHGKQGLVAVAIGKMISHESLTIWGNGETIRDYIYIDDLAESVYQLIDRKVSNDAFNIGSGIGYSNNEILHFIEEVSEQSLTVIHVKSRNVDVDRMVLDNQKLKNTISVNFIDIKTGIKKFVDHINHMKNE